MAVNKRLELNLKYAPIWGVLGGCFSKVGNHKEAINCFQKVIQINPNDPRGNFCLGGEYYLTNRYQDAIDAFTVAVAIKPNEPIYLKNLAFLSCNLP